eukprot:scaffold50897_cov31-Phaeocystis_antarctica.AAC.2
MRVKLHPCGGGDERGVISGALRVAQNGVRLDHPLVCDGGDARRLGGGVQLARQACVRLAQRSAIKRRALGRLRQPHHLVARLRLVVKGSEIGYCGGG